MSRLLAIFRISGSLLLGFINLSAVANDNNSPKIDGVQSKNNPALLDQSSPLEKNEIVTVLAKRLFQDTTLVSPSSKITVADLNHINFTTVEDAISLEPSLIVRRRFIGDPNGVIGIRGTNMFQGTRSMVYVDGMPLHYHLQTRFAGSPRWSLVSPSEVSEVNVIYGPFSAEYSGNSMGGVVNIETKMPEQQKIIIEGNIFSQDYDVLATDETFNGGKLYLSFEDRVGELGVFASYNRLDNDSQPMTQYRAQSTASALADSISGGIVGVDERSRTSVFYGDSGPESATTDLYKLKFDYQMGNYQLRNTIAYEQRQRQVISHNNFLTISNGNNVWSGTYISDGQEFSARGSNFQQRRQARDSLLFGLGFSGLVSDTDWVFDTFFSDFKILDDKEIRTGRNPVDPDFTSVNNNFGARLTEYDDTGWQILDVKFGNDQLGDNGNQRVSVGLHWDSYELNIIADDFNSISGTRSADEQDGNRATGRSDSGGQISTMALYFQYGYAVSDVWDLSLGLRYDDWATKNGYSGANTLDKRSDSGVSPKFSVGYFPSEDITWRYSIGRAIRFPIIEELYRNDGATSSGSVFVSDPSLKPEDGLFHNASFRQQLGDGFVSVNVFYDVVEDVIFNQSTTTSTGTVTTSLPTEEVTTKGAEFVWHKKGVLIDNFDLRYNLSFVDAEITKNVLNPSIIGNEFPRLPKWRSHLVATYAFDQTIDLSGSIRFASNSSGRLDNTDTANNVFGAQDKVLFFGLKANWRLNDATQLSFGIDNFTNEEAYVFHPWPFRTLYLQGKYVFSK